MKSSELIKRLQQDGWERVAVRGSHYHFKHHAKPGRVTVPHPKKDLVIGLVGAILRQAGIQE